jgi:fucose 4-O-acetylase-like acetyltransferase
MDDTRAPQVISPVRHAFIDQLRGLTTLLVVLHHTAITYGGAGGWYYREVSSNAPGIAPRLLTLMCAVDQAWFMGAFFLWAGYFTPVSYDRKGPARYFAERLVRLGIPLVVFGFFLDALTNAIADMGRGRSFEDGLVRRVLSLEYHPGPLWFVQALLVFSVAFAVWRRIVAAAPQDDAPLPSHARLLVAAIVVGLAAFAVRLAMPTGHEWWHWQLGFFPMYVLLFAVGCAAARHRWLERIEWRYARPWVIAALIAVPALPAFFIGHDAITHEKLDASGGLNAGAFFYAMWEPFVAWGAMLGLMWFFRTRVSPDRFARLGRRAYAIYCFHPPVVVAISVALLGWTAPPLVKFVAAGALSCATLYLLCGALLRLPGVSRVW